MKTSVTPRQLPLCVESDPTGFDHQHDPMHIQEGIGLVWGSVRDPLPDVPRRSPLFDELAPGESSYDRYDARIADLTVHHAA